MLPFLVRHCARLITQNQMKFAHERLGGRPYQGQVAEFLEVVHFRDFGKAADMPKSDDRQNLGLWQGKSLASDEHKVGDFGLSPQVSIHLEAPRETTLGQEDVG